MPKGLEGSPLPWPPPAGLPGRARAPPPSPPPGATSPLTRLSPGGNSPATRWPPPQQHTRPGSVLSHLSRPLCSPGPCCPRCPESLAPGFHCGPRPLWAGERRSLPGHEHTGWTTGWVTAKMWMDPGSAHARWLQVCYKVRPVGSRNQAADHQAETM